MNARELKDHLWSISQHQGENALNQDELDFLHGLITYNTYLERCYAQYRTGRLSKKRPPKS